MIFLLPFLKAGWNAKIRRLYLPVKESEGPNMPMRNRAIPPMNPQRSPEERQMVPTLGVTTQGKHIQHHVHSSTDVGVKESVMDAKLLSQLLHLELVQQENAEEEDGEATNQQTEDIEAGEERQQTDDLQNEAGQRNEEVHPTDLRKGSVNIHILHGTQGIRSTLSMRE